jgi:hypothetical protein
LKAIKTVLYSAAKLNPLLLKKQQSNKAAKDKNGDDDDDDPILDDSYGISSARNPCNHHDDNDE